MSIRKYVQNFINSRVCFDHHHIIKRNDGGAAEKPKSPIMQSSKRILSIQEKIGFGRVWKTKTFKRESSQLNENEQNQQRHLGKSRQGCLRLLCR